MQKWCSLAIAGAVGLLVACGGGETFQDQGPTEAGEAPLLSFEPIAGTWAGWGLEASGIQFWIRTTLSSSARRGQVVGTIQYGLGDTESEPDCRGDWTANNADHPVYVVAEEIGSGNCPDGRVVLTLDPETDELSYVFTPDGGSANLEAEGNLMRGTDPGPQP